MRKTEPKPGPWPPPELALFDTLEAIEAGRPEPQPQQLFLLRGDDRAARLARVLSNLPGLVIADKMEPNR